MKAILNKVRDFADPGDNFKLGRAIAVAFLLVAFVGATIYVLMSSLASA